MTRTAEPVATPGITVRERQTFRQGCPWTDPHRSVLAVHRPALLEAKEVHRG